jgi:hypothetical protein
MSALGGEFTGEMMLTRTGSVTLAILLLAGVLFGASPATAYDVRGPCDFRRLDGESMRSFSRRRIACAVELFGPVPGGVERAVCIARRESGLDPSSTSSPTGEYRGLYQHDRDLWPVRYERYSRPVWELSRRVLDGRTNAIVTIRMVADMGTWRRAGWPPKDC